MQSTLVSGIALENTLKSMGTTCELYRQMRCESRKVFLASRKNRSKLLPVLVLRCCNVLPIARPSATWNGPQYFLNYQRPKRRTGRCLTPGQPSRSTESPTRPHVHYPAVADLLFHRFEASSRAVTIRPARLPTAAEFLLGSGRLLAGNSSFVFTGPAADWSQGKR